MLYYNQTMILVEKPIAIKKLKEIAKSGFGDLVKAVIDIEKEIMVIDATLHADEEAFLIQHGSKQKNLWGINLYPDQVGSDFIEFDSMINLRPNQGNLSRSVDDLKLQLQIKRIVGQLVQPG
jgi:hypothetical protein